jgi:hypothetical protein
MYLNLRMQMQNVFVAGWILLELAHRTVDKFKRLGVELLCVPQDV